MGKVGAARAGTPLKRDGGFQKGSSHHEKLNSLKHNAEANIFNNNDAPRYGEYTIFPTLVDIQGRRLSQYGVRSIVKVPRGAFIGRRPQAEVPKRGT